MAKENIVLNGGIEAARGQRYSAWPDNVSEVGVWEGLFVNAEP
jgi:hypothetical protein